MGELPEGICQDCQLISTFRQCMVCCSYTSQKTPPGLLENYTMFFVAAKEILFAVSQQSRKFFFSCEVVKRLCKQCMNGRETPHVTLSEDLLDSVCSQVVH